MPNSRLSPLAEVKGQLNGAASVHVYSVSKALPVEDAALWGEDFLGAESLYNQPQDADNCQRDNRCPPHLTCSHVHMLRFRHPSVSCVAFSRALGTGIWYVEWWATVCLTSGSVCTAPSKSPLPPFLSLPRSWQVQCGVESEHCEEPEWEREEGRERPGFFCLTAPSEGRFKCTEIAQPHDATCPTRSG